MLVRGRGEREREDGSMTRTKYLYPIKKTGQKQNQDISVQYKTSN